MSSTPADTDFALWNRDDLAPANIRYTRERAVSFIEPKEASEVLPSLLYFITTVAGVLLVAIATGITQKALWPIVGILGGLAAGLWLIHQARTARTTILARVFMYAAAFILLFEVMEFIDAIVVHSRK